MYMRRPHISEFANIAEKTYAILAKFLPVRTAHIAERVNIAVFITNYVECLINYIIFQDEISTFPNFHLIAFGAVRHSTHIDISLYFNLLLNFK
jgi:hypothetical protein